ncbi:MAG: hypothetical protein HY698_16035 [Deltaproteobacteria bacterium]|nr:hypothetical protein [Deltaproteobacteria bacterium]
MNAAPIHLTLIILQEDGSREKHQIRSTVGVPRKTELLWKNEEPYLVVEVEFALSEGFFGNQAMDAVGVYVRKLTREEKSAIARRLAPLAAGPKGDEGGPPFR